MIKKNDLYLLIVIVIFASVFSLILANLLFKVDVSNNKVEVVKAIDSDFPLPPKEYFHKDSLNPTQIIKVGGNNPQPFKEN